MSLVQPAPFDTRPSTGLSDAPPRPASSASLHLAPGQLASSPLPMPEQVDGTFQSAPAPPLYVPFREQQTYAPQSWVPPGIDSYPMYSYDGSKMARTVSHAHPMHSADYTVSSRYTPSPHSAAHAHAHDAPPTATYWQQQPHQQLPVPALEMTHDKHINPNMLSSYPMSRSTSGASTSDGDVQRLLTPHFEHRDHLSPGPQDLRKVSDQLRPFSRYEPYLAPPAPVYAQPGMTYWGRDAQWKGDMGPIPENEYERERQEQISGNRRLLEELGLGHASFPRERQSSSTVRPRKVTKKRIHSAVRASPRIATLHRTTSYANLDGDFASDGSDSYSESDSYDDEEIRPVKRGRGSKPNRKVKPQRRADLSLWGLLQVYPQILDLFPLFYYTLNNDLSINSDSVPLIGSIPSIVSPTQKAEMLRSFFHRARRVLAQLDYFTARCDRKYEGPEERWAELDHHTRIAVRDVRRKVVERCENYKYTRRDLLDKHVGKNKWQPIEHDMIEWRFGLTIGDPAGDITNVTLTHPAPPPHIAMQTQMDAQAQLHVPAPAPHVQVQQQAYGQLSVGRAIRPMPSRARLASSRMISVNMDGSDNAPAQMQAHTPAPFPSAHSMGYPYSAMPTAMPHAHTPLYGEDQVPMSVQMPGMAAPVPQMQVPVMASSSATAHSSPVGVPPIAINPAELSASPVEQWAAKVEERSRSGSAENAA